VHEQGESTFGNSLLI